MMRLVAIFLSIVRALVCSLPERVFGQLQVMDLIHKIGAY